MQFRLFQNADSEKLAALMEQMQHHYAVPCPARGEIVANLLDRPPGVDIIVAVTDAVIGFAALCPLFPGPGLRKGLFLKELYVDRTMRGRGVGRGLIEAVAAHAVAGGYARVDWTADAGDPGLGAFYRATGARAMRDKLFYRLDGQALAATARPR